ncbi:hypothetical protein N9E07_07595 [Planktomarina temperata]|nr:hypothetical protein [Planktomarina temperata]
MVRRNIISFMANASIKLRLLQYVADRNSLFLIGRGDGIGAQILNTVINKSICEVFGIPAKTVRLSSAEHISPSELNQWLKEFESLFDTSDVKIDYCQDRLLNYKHKLLTLKRHKISLSLLDDLLRDNNITYQIQPTIRMYLKTFEQKLEKRVCLHYRAGDIYNFKKYEDRRISTHIYQENLQRYDEMSLPLYIVTNDRVRATEAFPNCTIICENGFADYQFLRASQYKILSFSAFSYLAALQGGGEITLPPKKSIYDNLLSYENK